MLGEKRGGGVASAAFTQDVRENGEPQRQAEPPCFR